MVGSFQETVMAQDAALDATVNEIVRLKQEREENKKELIDAQVLMKDLCGDKDKLVHDKAGMLLDDMEKESKLVDVICDLQAGMCTLKRELEESNKNLNDFKQSNKTPELVLQVENLNEALNKKVAECGELNKNKEQLNLTVNIADVETNAVRSKNEQLNKMLIDKEEERRTWEQKFEAIKKDFDAKNQQLSNASASFQKEMRDLTNQIRTAKIEKEDLLRQMQNIHQSRDKTVSDCATLATKCGHLESKMVRQNEDTSRLAKELAMAKTEIEVQKKCAIEMEGKYSVLKTKIKKIKATTLEIESLKEENLKLKSEALETENLRGENFELKKEMEDLNERNDSLENQFQRITNIGKNTVRDEEDGHLKSLEESVENFYDQNQKLTKEKQEIQSRLTNTEIQLNQVKQEKMRKNAENLRMTKQMRELERSVEVLKMKAGGNQSSFSILNVTELPQTNVNNSMQHQSTNSHTQQNEKEYLALEAEFGRMKRMWDKKENDLEFNPDFTEYTPVTDLTLSGVGIILARSLEETRERENTHNRIMQ